MLYCDRKEQLRLGLASDSSSINALSEKRNKEFFWSTVPPQLITMMKNLYCVVSLLMLLLGTLSYGAVMVQEMDKAVRVGNKDESKHLSEYPGDLPKSTLRTPCYEKFFEWTCYCTVPHCPFYLPRCSTVDLCKSIPICTCRFDWVDFPKE